MNTIPCFPSPSHFRFKGFQAGGILEQLLVSGCDQGSRWSQGSMHGVPGSVTYTRTLLSGCPVWKPRLVVWGSPARTPLGGGSWLGWLGWCFKGQCGYGKIWIAGAFRCTRTPRTPWTLDRPTMGVGQTMGVGILVKGRKLIRVLFFQVNLMSRFRSQGT